MLLESSLVVWLIVIYCLGTGRWGRAQTQTMIDGLERQPRVQGLLNRHHGRLRAAGHYVEFGVLTVLLYAVLNRQAAEPLVTWHAGRALITAGLAALAAFLDELHQLSSRTRQFRGIDYFYSCCGIALALCLVRVVAR